MQRDTCTWKLLMGTCCETICKHQILFPSIQHLAWLPQGVPRGNKNVVIIAIFGLTHWLKHRISYNADQRSAGMPYRPIPSHFNALMRYPAHWQNDRRYWWKRPAAMMSWSSLNLLQTLLIPSIPSHAPVFLITINWLTEFCTFLCYHWWWIKLYI